MCGNQESKYMKLRTPLIYKKISCQYCGEEIKDFTNRNQKFCKLTTGKDCARKYRLKVKSQMSQRDKIRENTRLWKIRNKERVSLQNKEYYNKNKALILTMSRERYNDKRLEIEAIRYKEKLEFERTKKDRHLQMIREWQRNHREELKLYNKRYYEMRKLEANKPQVVQVSEVA